jgi:hypothetical protein
MEDMAKDQPSQQGDDVPMGSVSSTLKPVLDTKCGYFVIGDADKVEAIYKLTIQIIHAKNLDKVERSLLYV